MADGGYPMIGAGEALQAAVSERLKQVGGLGVYEGVPVQAVFPFASVEAGPETDWGHKSGVGREVRLAVVLKDAGERPSRLRKIMRECENELDLLPREIDGWALVNMSFLRSRMVNDQRAQKTGASWIGTLDFRARMLNADGA